MKVGYIRVSTLDQNAARQLDGVELDKVFTDHASAKDAKRPQLEEMLRFVREGDSVYVHSIDRLARNMRDLLQIVEGLTKRRVSVSFVKEGFCFDGTSRNSTGNLLFNMLGAIAQFERELARERQAEGIAIAKAQGKYRGRKKVLNEEAVIKLQELASVKVSKSEIARRFGISRDTVYGYL